MSTLLEEATATSHVHLTFYSDINNFMGAYHHHCAHRRGQQGLVNIRTLPLSPVKPSPSSIKGDVLPPTGEINFPEDDSSSSSDSLDR